MAAVGTAAAKKGMEQQLHPLFRWQFRSVPVGAPNLRRRGTLAGERVGDPGRKQCTGVGDGGGPGLVAGGAGNEATVRAAVERDAHLTFHGWNLQSAVDDEGDEAGAGQ